MSRKAQVFANIITNPLNTHNFLVTIPGFSASSIVESTTFPTEKHRIITLWTHGEQVRYPGLPSNDGTWAVKVPENDDGSVQRMFEQLRSGTWDQKTGLMVPQRFKNVEVAARDLADNQIFKVILHGAWVQGRDSVSLAASAPDTNWNWDYSFVYSWIEDVAIKTVDTGVNPFK